MRRVQSDTTAVAAATAAAAAVAMVVECNTTSTVRVHETNEPARGPRVVEQQQEEEEEEEEDESMRVNCRTDRDHTRYEDNAAKVVFCHFYTQRNILSLR